MKVSIDELEKNTKIKPYKVLSYKKIVSKSKDFEEEALLTDFEVVKNIILKLCKTCFESGGVGIAAPQVGIFKKLFVIRDFTEEKDTGNINLLDTFHVFINPSWSKIDSEQIDGDEGCLSVPDVLINVKRYKQIKARWVEYSEDHSSLIFKEETIENYKARVFQHEHDHLRTISLLDKYKEQKKGL